MAISAAVFVGGMGPYREALIEKAKSLKVRLTIGICRCGCCEVAIVRTWGP